MTNEVENVARAFYYAEGDGQAWENEPEILKAEFRSLAFEAIALLESQSDRGLRELDIADLADAA